MSRLLAAQYLNDPRVRMTALVLGIQDDPSACRTLEDEVRDARLSLPSLNPLEECLDLLDYAYRHPEVEAPYTFRTQNFSLDKAWMFGDWLGKVGVFSAEGMKLREMQKERAS